MDPIQPPKKRKHPFSHRVEYAIARSPERAVSTLPENAADSFGKGIGGTLYRMGIRRDTVESNLRLAFPGQPEEWIRETMRKSYEHLGREAAAMMRLSKLDPKAVVDRTEATGWDELEQARELGKGVILVTGHYGNWEIAAAAVAAREFLSGRCPAPGK